MTPTTPIDVPKVLAACPLFASVRDPARQRLIDMAQSKTFRAEQVIFSQGQPVPGLFVVDSGLVRIFKVAPTGREHVLHVVGPSHTFAEVAVLSGFPCPANAAALETSRCIMLPTKPLIAALQSDHALCLQLLTGMGRWVHHVVQLLENIVLRDAAARVAHYLLTTESVAAGKVDVVKLPMRKQDLANHLNLTGETLSRVLRRLTDQAVIESIDRRHVHLLDRTALEQLSNGVWPVI